MTDSGPQSRPQTKGPFKKISRGRDRAMKSWTCPKERKKSWPSGGNGILERDGRKGRRKRSGESGEVRGDKGKIRA